MSSLEDHDNNPVNVLEPIAGNNRLNVTYGSSSVTLKVNLDASKINANSLTLTVRSHSEANEVLFESAETVEFEDGSTIIYE